MNMNVTTAAVFIGRKEPFETVIVYEQADIDWYRISYDYIAVGYVDYDTERGEILGAPDTMNEYVIKVNNAFIQTEAENEYDAINNLRIFGNPCLIEEYPEDNEWLYRVELSHQMAFANIKKLN